MFPASDFTFPLVPWQTRVLDEYNELRARIDKLTGFLENGAPGTNEEEITRLQMQRVAMIDYSNALIERISHFTEQPQPIPEPAAPEPDPANGNSLAALINAMPRNDRWRECIRRFNEGERSPELRASAEAG